MNNGNTTGSLERVLKLQTGVVSLILQGHRRPEVLIRALQTILDERKEVVRSPDVDRTLSPGDVLEPFKDYYFGSADEGMLRSVVLRQAITKLQRFRRHNAGKSEKEKEKEKVVFFYRGEDQPALFGDELMREYDRHGLSPADPYLLAKVNADEPSFMETHPNGTVLGRSGLNTYDYFCFRKHAEHRIIYLGSGENLLYPTLHTPMWYAGVEKS